MNDKKYRWILYFITTIIVVTIGIQIYWNYKNYQNSRQQLITEMQQLLDKTVDDYYADLAKKTTFGIFFDENTQKEAWQQGGHIEKILSKVDSINETSKEFENLEQLDSLNIKGVKVFRGLDTDTVISPPRTISNPSNQKLKRYLDSSAKAGSKVKIDFSDFEMLTSKVVVSINNDSLDVRKVNELLTKTLNEKEFHVDHRLNYIQNIPNEKAVKRLEAQKQNIPKNDFDNYRLMVESKSTFLPKDSRIRLTFGNETLFLLKRGLWGILVSTVLVFGVISCLFYLLNIIKKQKQLAEVKNDLISNITHEFKTPIATIGVALESINNFDGINSKEKTKKYIDMSSAQLKKLNLMVEKILETASLDSESLELNFERINLNEMLSSRANKFQSQHPEKVFRYQSNGDEIYYKLDSFHFENAINNILDNAVKYGGNHIVISLEQTKQNIKIQIIDDGNDLTKAQSQRLFEKFYRVPKGNTHNIKGFGIGLYYTKTIIDKHSGAIKVDVSKQKTNFIITLPL